MPDSIPGTLTLRAFLNGLKDNIKAHVIVSDPFTLDEAMTRALHIEEATRGT